MAINIMHPHPAADLLDQFEEYPVLSREEEFALAQRLMEQGDLDAAHRLITANLRYVVYIALTYTGYRMSLEDIVQEGTLGLMIAVKKFNPYKGYRLMTYAVWWIKSMIHDYILKCYSLVKLGTTKLQKRLFYKMNHLLAEAAISDGNITEQSHALSSRLKADSRQIEEILLRLKNRDYSLDSPLAEGSNHSYLDFIADTSTNPEDQMIVAQQAFFIKNEIDTVLANLTIREQEIVRQRLLAEEPQTLCELSHRFTISKERVRQIENKVKVKFKQALEDHIDLSP